MGQIQIFLADRRYYPRMIRPRMTEFSTVTLWWGSMCLGVSLASIPRGRGPSLPLPKRGTPTSSLGKQASFVPGVHARL